MKDKVISMLKWLFEQTGRDELELSLTTITDNVAEMNPKDDIIPNVIPGILLELNAKVVRSKRHNSFEIFFNSKTEMFEIAIISKIGQVYALQREQFIAVEKKKEGFFKKLRSKS